MKSAPRIVRHDERLAGCSDESAFGDGDVVAGCGEGEGAAAGGGEAA